MRDWILSLGCLSLLLGCTHTEEAAVLTDVPPPVVEQTLAPASCFKADGTWQDNVTSCRPGSGAKPAVGFFQTSLDQKKVEAPCDIQIIANEGKYLTLALVASEKQDPDRCNVKESIVASCDSGDQGTDCHWTSGKKGKDKGRLFLYSEDMFWVQWEQDKPAVLYAMRVLGKENRGLVHTGTYRPTWHHECSLEVFPVLGKGEQLSHLFVVSRPSTYTTCPKVSFAQRLFVCSPSEAPTWCWHQGPNGMAMLGLFGPRQFALHEVDGDLESYFRIEGP